MGKTEINTPDVTQQVYIVQSMGTRSVGTAAFAPTSQWLGRRHLPRQSILIVFSSISFVYKLSLRRQRTFRILFLFVPFFVFVKKEGDVSLELATYRVGAQVSFPRAFLLSVSLF